MQAPRFEIPACPAADVQRLVRDLRVSGALGQVLVRRGLSDPGRAQAFLAASEEQRLIQQENVDVVVGG